MPSNAFLAIYAVFDGHNGPAVADLCRVHFVPVFLGHPSLRATPDIPAALRAAIAHCEALALSARLSDGATLAAAVVHAGLVHVAHVGDSRIVLVRRGTPPTPKALTEDHCVSHAGERARVTAAGGVVRRSRLIGAKTELEVSRALGDWDFKKSGGTPALSSEPDVGSHRVGGDDAALLVATDGLYGLSFFDDDALAEMAVTAVAGNVSRGAESIVREGIRFGSRDNVALVLVRLHANSGDVERGGGEKEGKEVGEVSTSGRPKVGAGMRTVYWEGSRVTERKRSGGGSGSLLRRRSSRR